VVTGRAYTYYEYWAPEFERQLDGLAREAFDLVHLDSLDLYRWADRFTVPVACTHHNIESELLRLRSVHLDHPVLARYVAYQARLTERVEQRMAGAFALNLMMSSVDEQRLRRLAPSARTTVVPNGVDTGKLRPTPPESEVPGRVVFLGPLYMFPNRDGIEFFISEVWPAVRHRRPDATLRLIGAAADSDRERLGGVEGVECLGFVNDITEHIAAAECCIVPLRVGGGTRLKLLDYWALGKAVVSTSLGAEGLALRDGDNILLRDSASAFADATVALLDDPQLRHRIGTGARKTAEEVYDWNLIGNKLLADYRGLLK
jgi:glycosyltransferase involved in cell wall biosynthesis